MKTITHIALVILAGSWAAASSALANDATVTPTGGDQTITVTTLDDISDFGGAQQIGDLPGLDGKVSFREAVAAANNTTGPQIIAFAVPPSEFWLIPGVGLLRLEEGAFFLNDFRHHSRFFDSNSKHGRHQS